MNVARMKCLSLAGLAILGACFGTSRDRPDPLPDADPSGRRGVHLNWVAQDPDVVPGTVRDSVEIDRAAFTLGNVRIIGDADTVLVDEIQLVWREGMSPSTSTFVDASPGIYSRLGFVLTADRPDHSFELAGSVTINGELHAFAIHDDESLAVSVELRGLTLSPANQADTNIRVDLGKLFDHIDFSSLPTVEGVLVLDEENAQIAEVRKAVRDDTFSQGNSARRADLAYARPINERTLGF